MESLWPQLFTENILPTPKEIVEQQLKYLPKLTGDLVYGELNEMDLGERLNYFDKMSIGYKFIIRGKFLESYAYRAFSFAFNIVYYPVQIRLDAEIASEINKGVAKIKVNDETELKQWLSTIFKSKQLKNVIGSLMKLSI